MTLVSNSTSPSIGVWADWRRKNFDATGKNIAENMRDERRKKQKKKKTKKRKKTTKKKNNDDETKQQQQQQQQPCQNHCVDDILVRTIRRCGWTTPLTKTARDNLLEFLKRLVLQQRVQRQQQHQQQQLYHHRRHEGREKAPPPTSLPPEPVTSNVAQLLAAMSLSPTATTTTTMTSLPEDVVRVTWIRAPNSSGTCYNDIKTSENAAVPPPPPPPPPLPPLPPLLL